MKSNLITAIAAASLWLALFSGAGLLIHCSAKPAPIQWSVMWIDETNVQQPETQYTTIEGTTIRDALDAFDVALGDRLILSVCRVDTNRCPLPKRSER